MEDESYLSFPVFFVLLFLIILLCTKCRENNRNRNREVNRPPQAANNRNRNRVVNRTPQTAEGQTEETEQDKKQRREDRRFRILTNIVHKKAVAKTEQDEEEEQVILPHEQELSRRSVLNEYDEEAPEEQDPSKEKLKTDITLKALSSWRRTSVDSMRSISARILGASGRENSTESLYSPKTCPICIDNYKVGDDICWSKNKHCHHAFHLDCMVEWLMDNDECPLCREKYLEEEDEEER